MEDHYMYVIKEWPIPAAYVTCLRAMRKSINVTWVFAVKIHTSQVVKPQLRYEKVAEVNINSLDQTLNFEHIAVLESRIHVI